jgi:hypothetical protein
MDTKAIQQLAEKTLQSHLGLNRLELEFWKRIGDNLNTYNKTLMALCEMFEAGAAAASPQLKWVKASERLPEKEEEYYIKGFGEYKHLARFEEGEFYDRNYNDKALPFALFGLEWLEEAPAPQAIPEQEEIKNQCE